MASATGVTLLAVALKADVTPIMLSKMMPALPREVPEPSRFPAKMAHSPGPLRASRSWCDSATEAGLASVSSGTDGGPTRSRISSRIDPGVGSGSSRTSGAKVPGPPYHRVVSAVQELVHVLEDAFAADRIVETGESQSMLGNLATVPEESWLATPPGGERTIASVVLHVGGCIVMYDEYAFGPGRKRSAIRTRPVEPRGSSDGGGDRMDERRTSSFVEPRHRPPRRRPRKATASELGRGRFRRAG